MCVLLINILILYSKSDKTLRMEIKRVSASGFANLDSFDLELSKFNALVALNNYGKSNAIMAVDFGIDFIGASPELRRNMMAFRPFIPINIYTEKKPFCFEVELEYKFINEDCNVLYGFSFDWAKDKKGEGKIIRSEYLKIKTLAKDSKYRQLISREDNKALYLPSASGRCDKPLKVREDELALNKLQNFDELFYIDLLDAIDTIEPLSVNTLQHPNKLFRTITDEVVKTEYSLDIPKDSDVAFFIYSLKMLDKRRFSLFSDVVKSLLPSLVEFDPIEIDVKGMRNKKKIDVPLTFPEKIYDISVKEKNCNQFTAIASLSSGSQKLFYVLAMAVAAEINEVPLIMFEELENSIHPGLLQKLLQVLAGLMEKTKVLITSHSPYLLQYLDIDEISIGIPNKKGLAVFKKIKKTKMRKATELASQAGISIGDLIFDQMIESAYGESKFLNQLCG